MAEKMNKILHKRSVQPNDLGNGPKLPAASILEYGEIAVNYGAGHEALSFKNNNDEVVSLRTDEYYQGKFNDVIGDIEATEARITDITTAIEENEEVAAAALTDLDERVTSLENTEYPYFSDENLGYNQSGYNYPVVKDEDGKLYVNVEWTDENTTYAPVTSTEDGLMSSTDKSKLDSITIENGKVINVDALTDGNLGYETANGNYGIQKDDNGLLYVSVNTEQFETLGNKSETLSEESTHNQYPTSKAVYDVIVSNERVTAAGLSNMDERVKTLEKQIVENAVDEEGVKEIITEVLSDFDETVSGNSTFVTVSVSQTDGRISNVTVSDSGIASTAITDALDGRLDIIEGSGEGSIKKAVADEASLRSTADEALDAKITILNGDANTTGSVKNTVTTEIAKVVANAPKDLDTLKEIADYIASDKTHAAQINTDIANLKTTLTGFDTGNTVGKKFEAIESSIKDVRDIFGEGFSSGNTVEKVITDNERVTAAALNSVDNRLKFIESNGMGSFGDDNLGFVETDGNYAVKKDDNEKLYVSVNTEAFETRANKSLELSADSTDNHYPSSKAVYDYVNTIEEGTAASLNALDGKITSTNKTIDTKIATETNARCQADEALDAKIINLSAHVDEIDEGAAAGLSNIDERVKTLENVVVADAVNEERVKEIINTQLGEIDLSASGSSTFVTVTVTQTDGRISNVSVSDSGIAASSALTAEINARTSGDTALSNQITAATQNITTAYTAADEVLDGKITNVHTYIEEIEEATASSLTDLNDRVTSMNQVIIDNEYVTAGALNNLYDLINAYEARIASLETKLAAITIEE